MAVVASETEKKRKERNDMMEATQRIKSPSGMGFISSTFSLILKVVFAMSTKSSYMNITHLQLHASLLWLIKLVSVFSTG